MRTQSKDEGSLVSSQTIQASLLALRQISRWSGQNKWLGKCMDRGDV